MIYIIEIYQRRSSDLFRFIVWVLSLSAVLTVRPFSTATVSAQTQPQLLQQSHFTYLGSFRLPTTLSGPLQGSFVNANGSVSGNVYNDPVNGKSLFLRGAYVPQLQQPRLLIAQVKIPDRLANPDVDGLSTLEKAPIIQGFSDPTNGIINQIATLPGATGPQNNSWLSTVVYNGKLLGGVSIFFDASCQQVNSMFVAPLNFSLSSTATGPYPMQNTYITNTGKVIDLIKPRYAVGGYMTLIPPEWQSALGGKVVAGSGPTSIIGCASMGPSLNVIPADNLSDQRPTTLIYYKNFDPDDTTDPNDADQPMASLGTWQSNEPNQIVNGKTVPSITVVDPYERGTFNIAYTDNATRAYGILFAEQTRSVLFLGFKGLGRSCYGCGCSLGSINNPTCTGTGCGGEETWCYDLTVSGKADHSYPYTEFVWAYDVNDLIAVKNGTKKPWEVLPYTGWSLKLRRGGKNHGLGVSWDPETRKAYFVHSGGDDNDNPLVHVYQVAIPGADINVPANPRNLRVQ